MTRAVRALASQGRADVPGRTPVGAATYWVSGFLPTAIRRMNIDEGVVGQEVSPLTDKLIYLLLAHQSRPEEGR